MILAGFGVLIMITGIGVVGGTYYVDGVQTGDELTFPETTTIFYSDGQVLAKLGQKTRYPVLIDEMNDPAKDAIVASEDGTFWTNEGVDFRGVVRAAWNNFTGGSTQGASTITQQYARLAFDLKGATYNRKLREAVLAWKIDDELPKGKILESYLNSVPFGRNTYGIEAAAQAYFGKTVRKSAPPEAQITDAQAMALVAMVKQPEPDPANPEEFPGYDPTRSERAKQNAIGRWNYVRDQMVQLNKANQGGYLTPEENANIQFPPVDTWLPYVPNNTGVGRELPAGVVVNHVLDELSHTEGFFKGKSWESIESGGYSIFTTIDPRAQSAAVAAADETVDGSVMYGQPANLQAALVAVEPGTGRVLAYYGGHDGKGNDYAGIYWDENNEAAGFGRYPPGSSFKVYTLAAALKSGISLNSYWQWTPHPQQGRSEGNPIRNASTCASDVDPGTKQPKTGACTLLESTTQSLNIPFYDVTLSVSPAKVLEMARDAGIDYMWNDDRERQDLRAVNNWGDVTPTKFDTIVGIGQYPITVMDHANGVATFAADGLRAKAHFVSKVTKGEDILYAEKLPHTDQGRVLNQQAVNDLTYALSKVKVGNVAGWQMATKTGTWEYDNRADQNAHAWNVGFTKKIAAAVWVGNRAEEQAIVDMNGGTVWGSGLPSQIWTRFMTDATNGIAWEKTGTQFNQPNFIGNENPPLSVPSPTPSPVATQPRPPATTSKPPNGGGNGNPTPTPSTSTTPPPSGAPG
jgi:membrane peptidoglycan carboxypeptidase